VSSFKKRLKSSWHVAMDEISADSCAKTNYGPSATVAQHEDFPATFFALYPFTDLRKVEFIEG
jgi:hypothetical protein